MGAHEQIGLVALSSCREYESGAIRKHEFTRPDKEDDWVSHMESLEAQTGAVFLTYPADPELDRKFSAVVSRTVQVDFSSEDGVRHSAWVIAEEEELRFIEERFAEIPRLYIADSHQRSAAASRVAKNRAEKNGRKKTGAAAFCIARQLQCDTWGVRRKCHCIGRGGHSA